MSTSEKWPELQLSFGGHLQHCQEHYYQIKHLGLRFCATLVICIICKKCVQSKLVTH